MATSTLRRPMMGVNLSKGVTVELTSGKRYMIVFIHTAENNSGLYFYDPATSWLAPIQEATNVTLTASGTSLSWTSASSPKCIYVQLT